MKNWKELVHHNTFRYIDHTEEKFFDKVAYNALLSFAIDDALALSVSDGNSDPAVRLWVHPKTVVLGIPDARLPYIEEGVTFLKAHGYHVVVRNSGGLAVALDKGVLNISLILPDVKQLSIHESYEAMVRFVQYMLQDITMNIEAYEIVGSYCPGDYDLSIGGKKFAGISQRRVKDGMAVQIYLDVEGNGYERASFIRDFYAKSRKQEETKFTYPDVNPSTMASLSELLGVKLTVEDMIKRVYRTLEAFSDSIVSPPFSKKELELFHTRLQQMQKRNEPIRKIN
ncbi:lipoate--protein ligase family protein [Oceanobacillus halotolerans]|uniref:lipoate--protein ligase family protein n=1 Tax=Oceanobacillus halotolerans TaxID=2663380 RepID=UPI0013DD4741|nr:lipoate--protein ligase family protein [Oceanobacillus halotolerans]